MANRHLRPPLLLLSLLTAALAAPACSKEEITIDVGQRIHHDDFEYSVQHVQVVPQIGPQVAKGRFVVVTFLVENRAKRVEHPWTQNVAFLVDRDGRTFEHDAEAERAFAAERKNIWSDRHVTPAGVNETTTIVFDLPASSATPVLKVRGEFLMGDLFDANRYTRTRVRLPI